MSFILYLLNSVPDNQILDFSKWKYSGFHLIAILIIAFLCLIATDFMHNIRFIEQEVLFNSNFLLFAINMVTNRCCDLKESTLFTNDKTKLMWLIN